jgi:PleD family two-component response regulator
VTFSGGIASFDPAHESISLLEAADVALYAAKRAGRNQILYAEQREAKD